MKNLLKWVVIGGVFALPLLPLLVTGSLFFPYITGKNFAFRIIVEIITAAWLLLALYDVRYRPRFSWILGSFAIFTIIAFIADISGVMPEKSLWSNFERMEGFVTIIHLFFYIMVASSVLTTERMWRWFFNTSLVAATCVSLYAFAQLAGAVGIQQGGLRIDATLGNAIYMAIYMFFNVFIALYLLVQSRVTWMRVGYGVLALVFSFLLFATATRGTILGLAGGLFVAAAYAAYAARDNKVVQKVSLGVIALIIVGSGMFYSARDSAFVQENQILARIASISLEAGSTRFTIWGMALEGVKERPLLGWGQGNFNYVFNKYYDPSLYTQEPWFDRVHNVYLDWLIAAGLFGLLGYLAVWGSALRGLLARRKEVFQGRDAEGFSIAERAIMLGALAGYAIHSVFVFDNLISYFFFATILVFIHVRIARSEPMWTLRLEHVYVNYLALPLTALALGAVLYGVNITNMYAASDLLKALSYAQAAAGGQGQVTAVQQGTLIDRSIASFSATYDRHSFAEQEIGEQFAQNAQRLYFDTTIDADTKAVFIAEAKARLVDLTVKRPLDARVRYFLATLYGVTGDSELALTEYAVARELSPNKQHIALDMGAVYIDLEQYDEATKVIEGALALAPENPQARTYAVVAAIYSGDNARIKELILPPHDALYYTSDMILQAYYQRAEYQQALDILDWRIAQNPGEVNLRITKAQVEYQAGRTLDAVATIRMTMEDFPEFSAQGEQFIQELQNTLR